MQEPKTRVISSLEALIESEIDQNPSLLSKDRRIAAALVEGAAERSAIYRTAESDVDGFVNELLGVAELTLRGIRQDTVGKEVAAEEASKGSKTDEEYAREADTRRAARARAREEELRREREREEEQKRQLAEEKRRRRREDEMREKERAEREERKRAEREARYEDDKERQRERHRAREREREYERERDGAERRERRVRDEESSRYERDGHERRRSRGEDTRMSSYVKEENSLDEVALQLLLREGQELAAKSRPKPEVERSDSLEPPRRSRAPKSIVPRDPVIERLARVEGIMASKGLSGDMKDNISRASSSNAENRSGRRSQSPSRTHNKGQSKEPSKMEASNDNGGARSSNARDHMENLQDSILHKDDDGSCLRDFSREHIGKEDNANNHDGSEKFQGARESSKRHADHRDNRTSSRRRSRSVSPRRARHARSRSARRRSYYERDVSPRRKRSRSRSPMDIDRYVPQSSRSKDTDRRDSGRRDYERHHREANDREQRPRPADIDRYMPSRRDASSVRDGEHSRDKLRDSGAGGDRNRERLREHSRDRERRHRNDSRTRNSRR
jgi:hypothetical protein